MDSIYTELSKVTVGDVRDHNPKCRQCRFMDRCTGGCRNSVLISYDDYYAIDQGVCEFFEKGYGRGGTIQGISEEESAGLFRDLLALVPQNINRYF